METLHIFTSYKVLTLVEKKTDIINNEIQEQMMIQTDTAIEIADVVLFLTSIKEGVQRDDLEILKKLKKAKKKMVLAVNKCDKLRRNKSRFL